jgi:hypothetical protein
MAIARAENPKNPLPSRCLKFQLAVGGSTDETEIAPLETSVV